MLNDGPMPVSFKERVGDMLFGIFYVSLFLLQALPHIAIVLLTPSVLFYCMIIVGIAAGIVQNIKFPCFQNRIFSTGMLAATITLAFVPIT